MSSRLTHVSEDGTASMVDVSEKPVSRREATATAFIRLAPDTLAAIQEDRITKGNVLAVARIAGIQAAKLTWQLIPLCHQLPLSHVSVEFTIEESGVRIQGKARTSSQTGVEMEALTAVQIAALTIYDMCKAIDKEMEISEVRLLEKVKEPA